VGWVDGGCVGHGDATPLRDDARMTKLNDLPFSDLVAILGYIHSPEGIAELNIRMTSTEASNATDNVAEEMARRLRQISSGSPF